MMKNYNRNKMVLLASVIIASASAGYGATLSPDAALARALGNAPRKVAVKSSASPWRLVYTANRDMAYIFTNADGGFIVAAGRDDASLPLLGYGLSGISNPSDVPPALVDMIEAFDARPARVSDESVSRATIPPMVTCTWNQDNPFNNDCPETRAGKAVTGCEATAAAQIMYFYKYPQVGTGTASYVWQNGNRNQMLQFNYEEHPFDWDNMIDHYTEGEYTDAQAAAVANLMYGAGAGMNMQYSAEASACYDWEGVAALTDYLGYDPSCTLPMAEFYTVEEWTDMVYAELAAGHPLIYTGSTVLREGHAFVCDGYDGEYDGQSGDFFHINWGWGGNFDGYFPLTNLAPSGQGIGGGSGAFTEANSFFRNLAPGHGGTPGVLWYSVGSINTDKTVVEYTQNDAVMISYDNDSKLFPNVNGVFYFGIKDATIALAIKFTDVKTGKESYLGIDSEKSIEYGSGIAGIPIFGNEFPSEDGDYTVTVGYFNQGEWESVKCEPDLRHTLYCKVKNGYVTFAIDELAGEYSAVSDINADHASMPRYFNLQGVETSTPTSGIYIRVKDGRSEKILLP